MRPKGAVGNRFGSKPGQLYESFLHFLHNQRFLASIMIIGTIDDNAELINSMQVMKSSDTKAEGFEPPTAVNVPRMES